MEKSQKITDIDYEGMSLAEITARLGEPCHLTEAGGVKLRIWRQEEYYVILIFNSEEICFCLFDEGIDNNF